MGRKLWAGLIIATILIGGYLWAQHVPAPPAEIPRTTYEAAKIWVDQNLTPIDQFNSSALSSDINRVLYYREGGFMVVHFQSNPIKGYIYEGVPSPVFQAWKAADSKGKHYHTHIKGRYRFQLR